MMDASYTILVFGNSLNESLHPCETKFTNLFGTLLRFRCYKFALIDDIEKAFLSVGVKEEDRDALRFLWFEDPFAEEPVVLHYRFTRTCFGISVAWRS